MPDNTRRGSLANPKAAVRKSHLVVEHPHGNCCSFFLKCLTVCCAPCRAEFWGCEGEKDADKKLSDLPMPHGDVDGDVGDS
ncbi:hypothetical protein TrRE_jg12802 [Triparma retinervis]|uniref:Uncharacterized protein n=1 Tax=Triparma retinervis TaxID=2557542 RepID=A0A9W7EBY0_9STRA|nr:hypothetical protein TrRE_jg12802 [Triparma retinervis]